MMSVPVCTDEAVVGNSAKLIMLHLQLKFTGEEVRACFGIGSMVTLKDVDTCQSFFALQPIIKESISGLDIPLGSFEKFTLFKVESEGIVCEIQDGLALLENEGVRNGATLILVSPLTRKESDNSSAASKRTNEELLKTYEDILGDGQVSPAEKRAYRLKKADLLERMANQFEPQVRFQLFFFNMLKKDFFNYGRRCLRNRPRAKTGLLPC